MKHPTKEQFQTVIDNLTSVLPLAEHEGHLNMSEYMISENHLGHLLYKCGTVHCVGGWYGISCGIHQDVDMEREHYISFTEGCELMADHLGLSSDMELVIWARDNPEIWGNEYGQYLLSSDKAYDGAQTLKEVTDHFIAVQSRLPE